MQKTCSLLIFATEAYYRALVTGIAKEPQEVEIFKPFAELLFDVFRPFIDSVLWQPFG